MTDAVVTIYAVIGKRAYRGHEPGETFAATLDPAVEWRAVKRGDIRIERRLTPELEGGSWRLPRGWADERPAGSQRERSLA